MLNLRQMTDTQLQEQFLNGKIGPDDYVEEYNRRMEEEYNNVIYREPIGNREFI